MQSLPRLVGGVFFWACVCGWVGAQDREYVCRFTTAPPAIDGDLTDACWNTAAPSPVFHTLGPAAQEVPSRMKVRFLCDNECLYVAVTAESRPAKTPAAQPEHQRRGTVFDDDSVEVFLHTSPASSDYYHFTLNSDDMARVAHADPKSPSGQGGDAKWTADWKHATKKRLGGWDAEMAIPFKSLSAKPPQGFVWLVKVGSNAPGFPHAMWPQNPTTSFHEPTAVGYLIFRDRNLLLNGNVEGPMGANGVPEGWSFNYHDAEGKGIIRVCETDAPEGRRCIRYEKTTPEMWFPQLWLKPVSVQPHSAYRFSLLVNSGKRFVVRYTLFDAAGKRVRKSGADQVATKGYERRTVSFRVEDDAASLGVGVQLSQTTGVLWADDARLERVNDLEFKRRQSPDAHPHQKLDQLAARRPFKPRAQVMRGDSIQPERVIFKDTGTGATIWRLTDTPGGSTRHFYMEIPPWNCDGSAMVLRSSDWDGRFNVLLSPDGSAMTRLPVSAAGYTWDRKDPDRLYYCKGAGDGKTAAIDCSLKDCKETVLKTFEGDTSVWPVSQDNKYLLIRESFPGAPWSKRSRIHLLSLDGKEDCVLDPKGQIHQLWFTKLPDHSVEFEYEHKGFKTGDYPEGNFMMRPDGSIRRIYGGEGLWAGHRAHSPSGRLMMPGGQLQTVNKLTGEIKPLSNMSSNHQSWETDESWLAASADPYLIRLAADGRGFVQRIGSHNSGIGHSTYWTEAHPAMSPDGTKLGYASSMLGDIDFYFMVMMLPGRPECPAARTGDGKVALNWQPPKHAREIAGYLVYRARHSGGPYEQITRTAVADCGFTDAPLESGAFYYCVTSLERCGLESLKSAEVCTDPSWQGPVRHVFEAEFAPVAALPAMEEFDPGASGLYCMNLGQDKPAKDFSMRFNVPRDGRYSIWLRAKSPDNSFTLACRLDGGPVTKCEDREGGWRWMKLVGGAELAKGGHLLALVPSVPYVLVDQLLVTDDPAPPTGMEAADTTPPPPPTSLSARATGSYSIRFEWQAVDCLDFHHYNLYVSGSPECKALQENLVASPSATSYLHWGLLAGKTYYGRVTAVDRAGNESEPSPVAAISTPPIPGRLFAQWETKWRTRESPQTEVVFESPVETDVVVWTRWQSFETKLGETKDGFGLALDGRSMGHQLIRFGYICVGHGGPVPGDWLWNFTAPLAGGPDAEQFGFHVGKGRHALKLVAGKDSDLECGGIIVTNDLGFMPTGAYTSFLPMRSRE
jgi:Carbohydrate family 9 binding domain-like/Fibronectin type III domain